jgi:hypothetical protein
MLKRIFLMLLSVLLLISVVACESPVEPPMDNDANTEGTTGLFTESSSEAETTTEAFSETVKEVWYDTELYEQLYFDKRLFPIAPDPDTMLEEYLLFMDGFFEYKLLYTHNAPWEEQSKNLKKSRYVEKNPNVYIMGGLNEVITNYGENYEYYRCSIFFTSVVKEYAESIPCRGKDQEYPADSEKEVYALISGEEFSLLCEQNKAIFESNEVYAIEANYSDHIARVDCILTKEQILNFAVPSEEYSVIISFHTPYK